MAKIEKDYKLSPEKKTDTQDKIKETELPVYMETIKLTDDQKKRLKKEVFDEFEAIEEERGYENLPEKWDALDRQYEGKLEEDIRRQFNLTMGITRQHEDRIVNDIMEAFLDQEPRYDIKPRPGFEKAGGKEVAEKQTDFLDDRIDYLPFRPEAEKTARSSVRKGAGVLKIFHHIQRENRKRDEEYEGKNEVVGQDPKTKQPIIRNKGLEQFLANWPDAPKDYPGYIKKLQEEKKINIVAEYKDTIYNDAKFRHVDNKNFYCRLSTEGYEGLKTTLLIAERISMSWWELKRKEYEQKFTDIDELIYENKKDKKEYKNYKNKYYDILECVYYFKLNETDEEETKIVCWIAEEKRIVLGAILYPYFAIDCYYIPHFIKHTRSGFYQASIGEDLSDDEYAMAILLNSALEGAYISNLVTPITPEGSAVDEQFTEKRFIQGLPINAKPGEIDFLQKYMKPSNSGEMLSVIQYLSQTASNKTGVSPSAISGQADPLDPNAPARKTAMLLQQSNKFMKSYIYAIGPAFNTIGEVLLQLYYQISKEGRKYTLRRARVANDMPFAEITRNELSAKTIIEVRAYLFDFEKQNEKQNDLAFYQIFRQELLVAREPESVHLLLRTLGKSWSAKWKNMIDMLLPSLEQLKQEKLKVAVQAVAMYVQAKSKESQLTQQPMEFKMEELMPMIADMQAQIATPPPPEVQKEQEKKK